VRAGEKARPFATAEPVSVWLVEKLFREGMDTVAIARQLGRSEADIYNALSKRGRS
jgi:hypothetical protein